MRKNKYVYKPVPKQNYITSRDRIVVSTLRCGRNNPGSNPGHDKDILLEFFRINYHFFEQNF